MDTIHFLEQLAKNAHHRKVINDLIAQQNEEIKNALLKNDGEALKKQLNNKGLLADLSAVTQA